MVHGGGTLSSEGKEEKEEKCGRRWGTRGGGRYV